VIAAAAKAPHIDWAALSPVVALFGGALLVLIVGMFRSRFVRESVVPFLTLVALGASLGLSIWQWDSTDSIVSGALRIDNLALVLNVIFLTAGMATVLLAWRALAPREAAHGEWFALLLVSISGMLVIVAAQNLVTVFLGLELLSIPLYVLCATELRREGSLESGLKYLIIGSVGSATFLYGLAFIYGASGSTDFGGIATGLQGDPLTDPLFLTGMALALVGLAFKASVAPFHQWTPDVYEGAPTAVTAFMATATKAAALGVMIRFFDVALIDAQPNWGPALAALAAITIVVGNVGALGQSSVKRILAWSSVAQAGYMLAGIVVSTRLGIEATVFYLGVYLVMNMAAFGVVIARERETDRGDDISALAGIGASRPLLAWPMTLAMLGLAGIPATAGFIGKLNLIQASVDGEYTWLAVFIVVGSMISLAYYLRIVAAMWMSPAPARVTAPVMAGGSGEEGLETDDFEDPSEPRRDPATGGPARAGWETYLVAVVFGAGVLVLGVVPGPLFDLAQHASRALPGLL
jgi:NADH-quinone oxidoreductase subunit N